MTADQNAPWGTPAWLEDQYPEGELDGRGDAWGIRWRGREKVRRLDYARLLAPQVRQPHPLDILDLGCGLCDFTVQVESLNPANRFWLTDISPTAIRWTREHFPHFNAEVAALPEIPFDVQFDVILCLQLICYLNAGERAAAMRNIHDRLKPGGLLMFAGVLDGGEKHHTEEEVFGYLRDGFSITQIVRRHVALYKLIFESPFKRPLKRMERIEEMLSSDEQDDFHRRTGPKARVLRTVRASRAVTLPAVSLARRSIIGMQSLELPAKVADRASRMIRGPGKADELIILARRR